MELYAGDDFNLTLCHSRLRSQTFHPKDDKWRMLTNGSPIIQKLNNQQEKEEFEEGGGKGSIKKYFMEPGQPDA